MSNARILLSVVVVFAICTSVFGAVIYESFDYDAGSLVGQTGGAGWGGAWDQPSSATNGTEEVIAQGLTFSDYATSGGALKLVNTVDGFNVVGVSRPIGVDFTPGDDVWVSFLAKRADSVASNSSRTAEFRHGPTSNLNTPKLRIQPKPSSSQGITTAYDSTTSGNSASQSAQDGRTYLYICRFGDIATEDGKFAVLWCFDEAGYDVMNADGVIAEAELNANDYLMAQDPHANRTLDTMDSAFILLANSQGLEFSYIFDEIRYDTSLAGVLVPEPMTLVLLGVGTIGVLRKRK